MLAVCNVVLLLLTKMDCCACAFVACDISCIVYVVCSPAQAAAAPAVIPEQSAMLAAQYGRYEGRTAVEEHQTLSQLSQSPRVVCEPLRSNVQVSTTSLVKPKFHYADFRVTSATSPR